MFERLNFNTTINTSINCGIFENGESMYTVKMKKEGKIRENVGESSELLK